MSQNTMNGQGHCALGKPVPFYYGERAEKTPLERIDNLEKQLFTAQEMLATIERDGDFSSHLRGFYKSRVNALGLKLEDLKRDFPPVFFS
jgi:hypothetical protein